MVKNGRDINGAYYTNRRSTQPSIQETADTSIAEEESNGTTDSASQLPDEFDSPSAIRTVRIPVTVRLGSPLVHRVSMALISREPYLLRILPILKWVGSTRYYSYGVGINEG